MNVPEVTVEDLDGIGLEIRVGAAFPFGARLSVRRTTKSSVSDQLTCVEAYRIGFVAIASSVRRAA
jgi:hypothetical protein